MDFQSAKLQIAERRLITTLSPFEPIYGFKAASDETNALKEDPDDATESVSEPLEHDRLSKVG